MVTHPYNEEYYHSHCGPDPMGRYPNWLEFFGHIADHLVARFRPTSVLDVGCAMGLLVEALVDRGVDAHGIDISEFAVGQARRDIQPRLQVRDVTREKPADQPGYDLAVTIEVAEHLPPGQADPFIAYVCSQAPVVVFSSTPSDFSEPTHQNVRPEDYWRGLFQEHGFRRAGAANFIMPWAGLYHRRGHQMDPACLREWRYKWCVLRTRGCKEFLGTFTSLLPLRRTLAKLRGRS